MKWSEILAEIKRTLKEPANKPGHWSDSELLRRANLAQSDFCLRTQCISKTQILEIDNSEQKYLKPQRCAKITTLLYKGERLKATTEDEADALAFNGVIPLRWRENSTHSASPFYYVQEYRHIILCPHIINAGQPPSVKYYSYAGELIDANSMPFDAIDYLQEYAQSIIDYVLYKCFLEDKAEVYVEYKACYNDCILKYRRQIEQPDKLESFTILRR
jgi:hypothetical protein